MARELRKDPTTGRWTLVRRPREAPPEAPADEAECPFCPGNEALTPPEIVAYRVPGSATQWLVRVVPERDPYFAIEEDLVREGVGMFDRVSARGASEIVVEDPAHAVPFADLEEEQIGRVLWMYRDRIQDLKRDPQIRSVVVIQRHGKVGARIRHPYSRILASPIMFDELRTELEHAREYYDYKRRCVYCDALREEVQTADRLVRETAHFVAFVPYAARVPFDLRVLPRRHRCAFEEVSSDEVTDLARLLKSLLDVLAKALGDAPYELTLHSAPNLQSRVLPGEWDTVLQDYHWHLEIVPHPEQQREVAGIAVNDLLPEEAARQLREAGT